MHPHATRLYSYPSHQTAFAVPLPSIVWTAFVLDALMIYFPALIDPFFPLLVFLAQKFRRLFSFVLENFKKKSVLEIACFCAPPEL